MWFIAMANLKTLWLTRAHMYICTVTAQTLIMIGVGTSLCQICSELSSPLIIRTHQHQSEWRGLGVSSCTSGESLQTTEDPSQFPQQGGSRLPAESLAIFCISGLVLDWCRSYLGCKEYYVALGTHTSRHDVMSCGVPRGSIFESFVIKFKYAAISWCN